MKFTILAFAALLLAPLTTLQAAGVPQSVAELWGDFDPRKDPLETEILKEWEQDGVVCRIVRYRVGVFKGTPSRVAAFYAFPKGATKLPALLEMHGGGQSASLNSVVTCAKRGYRPRNCACPASDRATAAIPGSSDRQHLCVPTSRGVPPARPRPPRRQPFSPTEFSRRSTALRTHSRFATYCAESVTDLTFMALCHLPFAGRMVSVFTPAWVRFRTPAVSFLNVSQSPVGPTACFTA